LFANVKRDVRMKYEPFAAAAGHFSNGSFRVEYLLGLILKLFRNFYSLLRQVRRISVAAWDARLLERFHCRFSAYAAMSGFIHGKRHYPVLKGIVGGLPTMNMNPALQRCAFDGFDFRPCGYERMGRVSQRVHP
jgi:hypothetical protein